ncbi:hypothetical protein H4Q26_011714 [Puccinia striiformis f. sp. tritici PST-130]|nr:hypothetical protein H4Q26_011714 [Puccinia striiformis f. sp. tritici PST-130]
MHLTHPEKIVKKFDWSHLYGHPLENFACAAATSNRAGLPALATTSTVPNIQHLMYISTSMGLSLLFSAWDFLRATGAAFNPNVSLALLLTGVITPTRFILYVGAQLSASLVASSILKKLLPGPMSVVPNLAVGTSIKQGLLIEAFITCALVLSVLFLAVEKHRATYLAPVGISITLFACHLFGVVYTGAAMNSARAFGPAAVTGAWKDHWVYWVGPTIGSLLAVIIYVFMKRFEYWRSNEGQDTDVFSASPELFIAGRSQGTVARDFSVCLNRRRGSGSRPNNTVKDQMRSQSTPNKVLNQYEPFR